MNKWIPALDYPMPQLWALLLLSAGICWSNGAWLAPYQAISQFPTPISTLSVMLFQVPSYMQYKISKPKRTITYSNNWQMGRRVMYLPAALLNLNKTMCLFWFVFEAIQTSRVQKHVFKGCVHTKIKLFHLNIFGTKSASIQNAFKWYEVAQSFISVAVAFQLTLQTDPQSCWDSHCPASRPSCSCKIDRSSTAHCHNTNQTISVFTKMLFHLLASVIFLKTWSQDCILGTEGIIFFIIIILLAYCSHFCFLKTWSKSKQELCQLSH